MYQRLVGSLREEKIMNSRERFLDELEQELSNISKTEREEALQYYREYFEDANMSDEEVIKQLGSVESVAKSIRDNLMDRDEDFYHSDQNDTIWSKYTSKIDEGFRTIDETAEDTIDDAIKKTIENVGNAGNPGNAGMDSGTKILLIVLCVIFSPVLLGVAGSLIGVVVSLFASFFAFLVAIAACAIAFGVAAIACLCVAITQFMAEPLLAVLLLGACMFFTGLCFLFTLATLKIVTFVIPGLAKGIAGVVKSLFQKKKKELV